LNDHFALLCGPDVQVEQFQTRDDDDFTQADLDVFSYAANDDFCRFLDKPKFGFHVPTIKQIANSPVKTITKSSLAETPSPNWTSNYKSGSKLKSDPQKYIVGEAYSGSNEVNYPKKLKQLEQRLLVLGNRYKHRNKIDNTANFDIYLAVFGSILILTPQAKAGNTDRVKKITLLLKQDEYPLLHRLVEVGRFVICIVPHASCPITTLASSQHIGFRMVKSALYSITQTLDALVSKDNATNLRGNPQ
jgi:hypothetical protein